MISKKKSDIYFGISIRLSVKKVNCFYKSNQTHAKQCFLQRRRRCRQWQKALARVRNDCACNRIGTTKSTITPHKGGKMEYIKLTAPIYKRKKHIKDQIVYVRSSRIDMVTQENDGSKIWLFDGSIIVVKESADLIVSYLSRAAK